MMDRAAIGEAEFTDQSTLPERTRLVLQATRMAAVFNIVNGLALIAILWRTADHWVAIAWFLTLSAVSAARVVHCVIALKREWYRSATTRWVYTAGAGAAGVMWGLTPLVFADLDPSTGFHAVPFMIAGMTAAAAATMSHIRAAYFAYTWPAVLPLAYHYIEQPAPEATLMALVLLLYLAGMILISHANARAIIKSIKHEKYLNQQSRDMEALAHRYKGLYTATPVMLHSIDPQGRLLSVSDFWLKKLGYTRGEVIGRRSTDFLTPDSARKAREDVLPEFMRTGVCQDIEYQFLTKSGEALDVLLSGVAEYDEHGKVRRSMAVLIDVTDRKRMERQLVQAQKMETVGQLTGGLAHDFNNLLGVVLGNLQLVERSVAGDEKAERRVAAALGAVERGAELTRRLLAFSRRQKLETETFDPKPLIDSLSDLLERTLGEDIALECRLRDGVPCVRTDPAQLESAILNLAVNARDAMPDGGSLTIESDLARIDEDDAAREGADVTPGDYAVLAVTDTGTGIPADKLAHVFEPFFTTKETGKGSGLGLSMVYGFMKQSGGFVRIYSEIGRGTTVRLYLPIDTCAAGCSLTAATTVPDAPGGGETILVVEDQADVREIAAALLEDLGYVVVVAEDGPSGLRVLKEREDIQVLFTDMVMPGGMDGAQLATAARELRPDLRVVYTTGYADAAVLREGRITEATNLVTKPYRRADLATKIRRALDDVMETGRTETAA